VLVLHEGKVSVWQWRQIAEESRMLRALQSQTGYGTPLGRKRFPLKLRLPSSPFHPHRKRKPRSAALSFFLSLAQQKYLGCITASLWQQTKTMGMGSFSTANPAALSPATLPLQQHSAFHMKNNTYFGKQKTIHPMPPTSINIFHKI